MANYTANQPTTTAHKNIFVIEGQANPGRPDEEYRTNMLISYAQGRIVNIDGKRLQILDDGETFLGDRDVTPYTQWKCREL